MAKKSRKAWYPPRAVQSRSCHRRKPPQQKTPDSPFSRIHESRARAGPRFAHRRCGGTGYASECQPLSNNMDNGRLRPGHSPAEACSALINTSLLRIAPTEPHKARRWNSLGALSDRLSPPPASHGERRFHRRAGRTRSSPWPIPLASGQQKHLRGLW